MSEYTHIGDNDYELTPGDYWDKYWVQPNEIREEDWIKIKQSVIHTRISLEVFDVKDDDMYFPIGEIQGVLKGGNVSVNSGSATRRTASFELTPSLYKREQEIEQQEIENDQQYYVHLGEDLSMWLDKKILVILWIRNYWYGVTPTGEEAETWYPFNMGMYMLSSAGSSYDASTNTLSIELTDMMCMLDGTLNGQVGGVISTVIPAYEEDPDTGEPISYNSIKKAIMNVCEKAGLAQWQYLIDDVGEHMAFPMFNMSGWEKYREEHPLWNMIPYDLEFSPGCTMWSIIEELVNLYPNFDAAFDKNGIFRVRLIPSSGSNLNIFGFQNYYDLIISEQVSTDVTNIRNICEVWGENMDTDWYTDDVTQGKYVVYVLEITRPDASNCFYIDIKYIIQEKTIKTDRITIYKSLTTDTDWEELKIYYTNQTLEIKALKDGIVYNGNTFNTDQVIYTCTYDNAGIPTGSTPDTNYTYDSNLGWSCLNEYYVSSTEQLLSTHNTAFYKTVQGGAIAVEWHADGWYGPVLISTVADYVKYTGNLTPMNSIPIDGVVWHISSLDDWNYVEDPNRTIPLYSTDYVPSADAEKAIRDILTASHYTMGQATVEGSGLCQLVMTRTSELDIYEVPLEGYPTKYRTGDRIAVQFRTTNFSGQAMRINNLDPLPIIDQSSKSAVGANFFDTKNIHVFMITKVKTKEEVEVPPAEHALIDHNIESDVSEYGTASQYNAASDTEAWYAFKTGKKWTSGSGSSYIQFTFPETTYITMIHFYGDKGYHNYEVTLQKSIDGENFTSVCTKWLINGLNIWNNTNDFETFGCKAIRISFEEAGAKISSLTFLGYKESEITTEEQDTFVPQFYYLGVAQAHAIDILTDGTIIKDGWWDPGDDEHKGRYYDKYSLEYYQRILNCDTISLTVRKNCPYVVQKLGDRIDVKEGGEFENITSNELALERAQYENWKNARITDNVTITTKLFPFVEPYMKIDYKKANSKEKRDYIVQSVSHDFDNGTSTIQMFTFYPLYKENPGNLSGMTYDYMAGYTNEDLYGDEDEREVPTWA